MGKLVPSSIPFHMRNILTIEDRILFPCEGKELLKSKINMGNSFCFLMSRYMQ